MWQGVQSGGFVVLMKDIDQCSTASHFFTPFLLLEKEHKGKLTVIIYRRVKVFLKSVSAKGQLLRGEAAGEKSFVF